VDILVNDARSFLAKPFGQISLEEWEAVQARNARAVFLLCQALGPGMVRQGYGRIVNVISGLAERGMSNAAAFSASQAAVLSLTRSLAVEWGPHNVRVNALGLGWFSADDAPPEIQQQEQLVRYIPLRRRGHPRDVAPLLVYLCSQACDYSTGQPVYVDGGLNARA
jgi:NAD(P)-dependent dehydrogenase (short-subunit alcohol dehydrogenase family)